MNQPIKTQKKERVKYLIISEDQAGQRIDNFLIGCLKSVPKSHIYRILRKGEVRVNKKRISPCYHLLPADELRLPPLFLHHQAKMAPPSKATATLLAESVLYEDEHLLIINKPSGMSVHAGSTVRVGIIDVLRHLYPKLPQLELAHRLDSETSGCLILAKKKRILRELHTLLREGKITKIYWTLTKGCWKKSEQRVELPLAKHYQASGKHVVAVHQEGKAATTLFHPVKKFKLHPDLIDVSLLEVKLLTGRTHQIRVHAQAKGHPIAGDDRYGDNTFNRLMAQLGLKRLFLHAYSIDFILPSADKHISVVAPLTPDLATFIKVLEKAV